MLSSILATAGAVALAVAAAPAPALTLGAATPSTPSPTPVALIETPDLSNPTISPDGRFVLYRRVQASVAANSYDISWWIAPLTAPGAARRIADGGGPVWMDAGVLEDAAPQWAADSGSVYVRALIGGEVQVWRAKLNGEVQAVTHDAADVEAFGLLDANRLVYRTGATRDAILRAEAEEAAHGVRIDASVDVAQSLFHGARINGRMAAQRLSGKWFARAGLLANTPPRFTVVDAAGQGARLADPTETIGVAPPDPIGRRRAPIKGPDGRIARLDGRATLRVDGAAGGAAKGLSHTFVDAVANFRWRPGHEQLLVATQDAAYRQTLWIWDLTHDQLRRLAGIEGTLSSGGVDPISPCALDTTVAVCVAAAPLSPPRLVSINLDTGRMAVLDHPQAPAPSDDLMAARTLLWTDPAGRSFGGLLMLPSARPTGGPPPLFITYYNCQGYLRGGTGDEWPLAPLAARGIATLCINQTASRVGPQDAVASYQAALSGVQTIVARLADQGLIDRRRVGMGGLSFGSEVVMWVATHSDLLAAASISSTQLEPTYYWFNSVAGRTQPAILKKVWGLGDPDLTPAAWRQVSPAMKIETIHTPILMQMVEQEFRYQMELYSKLSNTAVPVELDVFPDEPHIKTEPVHRLAVYQRNLDWFRFWLKGEIDPDPAKADQYRRWRSQRQAWLASAYTVDQPRSQSSTSASSNNR